MKVPIISAIVAVVTVVTMVYVFKFLKKKAERYLTGK
jgi:hypothetical protein